MMDAAGAKPGLGHGETGALFAQQVLDGYTDVLHDQLARVRRVPSQLPKLVSR